MASPSSQQTDSERQVDQVWEDALSEIVAIDAATENWKSQALPLARIKKIMKSEENFAEEHESEKPQSRFMIAGEAPLLLGKACELLIRELTTRAWHHTMKSKRRTLQKQDLHAAVGDSDVYDFLIDIIPRMPPPGTDVNPTTPSYASVAQGRNTGMDRVRMEEAHALVSSSLPSVGQEAGLNLVESDLRLGYFQHQYQMMQNTAPCVSTVGGGGSDGTVVAGVQPPPMTHTMFTPMPMQQQTQQRLDPIPNGGAMQRDAVAGHPNR